MSDQGERWNAPGGDVNDYAPTDRSTGPKSQPNDANPFAAPTPQQAGSGVSTAAQQEPVVGRMTFSAEVVEAPEGRTDFSSAEFATPGFPPPPPLEPAASESATSGFPAPELPTTDFPARRYPESDFISQGFTEDDFPPMDPSFDRAPEASASGAPGSEPAGETFPGGPGAPAEQAGAAQPSAPPAGWDSHAFDGVESGAGDSNYAGVDMSGPGTPPKPGMPSSGNWRMPEWMAEESKDGGGSSSDSFEAETGGRSRVGLFVGVSLLVIALVASATVFLLKSGGGDKSVQPSTPAKGSGKKSAKPPTVALPPDKQLPTFPGAHTKAAGRINDTFSGLSYPRLGAPWKVPTRKSGLALLGWSGQQIVVTEHTPKQLWYAQLLSGVLGPAEQDIYAGPGTERAAAAAYAQQTEARLYGFAHKTKPLASQPLNLNGHKGWLISSYLTFHRPGIKATGDVVTVAVIDAGRKTPAVLFMAVPNTSRKLWPDINFLVGSLKVLP
ncbi:hypothetical protein ACRYCC_02815 [Actinomadura scrupuli]|uniref:hypothetical protein n=1 Tax=Actinomadura scrupuli TaxID=559629 RepID=UPI003D957B35